MVAYYKIGPGGVHLQRSGKPIHLSKAERAVNDRARRPDSHYFIVKVNEPGDPDFNLGAGCGSTSLSK